MNTVSHTATPAAGESPVKTPGFARALAWGGVTVGLLDGTAACVQAWLTSGATPARLFQGVASALLGRAALDGSATTAALGTLMHFGVAFTATAVCYLAYRRLPALRPLPQLLLGALFGLGVFCVMNFAILPLLSGLRHLYLDTPIRWVGSMGWPQFAIHLVFVGQPIAAAARRFLR
jgi:hypothetical protein